MIEVSHITKTYRVARRDAGFRHAFRSLFRREYEVIRALDDVSFTIEDGEMVGYIGPEWGRQKLHHQNSQRNPDSGLRGMPD